VDVTLRKDMWHVGRASAGLGRHDHLTTHYIEEAEEIAIVSASSMAANCCSLGKKVLMAKSAASNDPHLSERWIAVPACLDGTGFHLGRTADLIYDFDAQHEQSSIAVLLSRLAAEGIHFKRPLDAPEFARGHLRIARRETPNELRGDQIHLASNGPDAPPRCCERRLAGHSTSLYFIVSVPRSDRASIWSKVFLWGVHYAC